jgi:hypothetical protein
MLARIRKGARRIHAPEDLDSFRVAAALSLRARPESHSRP